MFPIRWNFPFRKKDGSMSTIGAEIDEGGGAYTLPTASAETKGGVKIGSGLSMTGEVLNNSNPTPYVLPIASDEALGGVIVGNGLTITDGVLSNDNPTAYTLPTASDEVLGGVKVGAGLTMDGEVLKNTALSSIYDITLESGMSGFLKAVKNDKGFIEVSGAITLETPMTSSRVKLAGDINSDLIVGNTGYQWSALWAVGITAGFEPKIVDVRFYGSGNVWLYPEASSTAIKYVLINGIYRNDVYVDTN